MNLNRIVACAIASSLVVAACGGSSGDSTNDTRTRNAALVVNDAPTMIVRDIAAKASLALFLTDDNIVRVVGRNHHEVDSFRDAIAGKTISKIRVSVSMAAVLDSDGMLYVGGHGSNSLNLTLPAGATRWIDMSLGANDIVAIADNGEVRTAAVGDPYSMPSLANEGTKFVQVASGWFHHVLLDDKGNVYTTGSNGHGQRDLPALTNGGTRVVKVAANFYSTGLIDDKGNAYVFGWILSNETVPALTNGGSKFVDIAIGTRHAVLLDDAGNLYHVGEAFDSPFRIPAGITIVKIAAGAQRSFALDDKGIVHEARASFSTGGGTYSQRVPVLPVAASGNSTLVIDQTGKIVQLGTGLAASIPDSTDNVSIGAGLNHGLALNNKGEVRAWGEDGWGQVSQAGGVSNLVKVVGGPAWSAGLTRFGSVTGWGTGAPIQTNFDGLVRDIVAGHNHLTVLLSGGDVQSFGSLKKLAPSTFNLNFGRPADETPRLHRAIAAHGECAVALGLPHGLSNQGKPHFTSWGECPDSIASAPDLSKATALAIGLAHGAAIMTDGSITAWGDNSLGQTAVPPGLANAVFVSAGDNHTVAVDAEGRVWAWGDNSAGQTNIPTSLRLSAAELAAATEAAEEARRAVTAPTPAVLDVAESLAAATAALPAQSSTDAKVLATQLIAQLPADAPEGAVDAVLQSVPVDLDLNTVIAAPASPTLKTSERVTAARALSLLKIKGATKPSFIVTKRPKSSPCTVSKTRLTTRKRGMCSAVISYTNAKGKKARATFAVLVTS